MGRPREKGWPAPPAPPGFDLVDNHTHLESVQAWDAEGWDLARPQVRPALTDHLERAASVGVTRLVQVGCDLDAIAWTDTFLRSDAAGGGPTTAASLGAVAIHPNEAVLHAGVREIAPDGLEPDPQPRHDVSLDDAVAEVARVARSNERVRAIGETGLDFFRGGERAREVQVGAFRAHIALAKELGLPLQIHDRDAHAEVIEILLADGAPDVTVFHCFSGGAAMAQVCTEQGWYLSIAGPVTFKANDDGRDAVRVAPLSRLLLETDAPYLTPHPYRGRPNSPYLLPHTVAQVARVRDESVQRVAEVTTATALELYGSW